jgi:hypothetical protein
MMRLLLILGPLGALALLAKPACAHAPIERAPRRAGLILALEGSRHWLQGVPFDAVALGMGAGIRVRKSPWLSLNPMGTVQYGRTESGLGVGAFAASFGTDFLLPGFHIEPSAALGVLVVQRITQDALLSASTWSLALRAGPEIAIGDAGHLAIDAAGQLSWLVGLEDDGSAMSYGLRLRYRFY